MYTVDTPSASYRVLVFEAVKLYTVAIWIPALQQGSLYPLNADNKIKSEDKESFTGEAYWHMLQRTNAHGELHKGCPLDLVELVLWIIKTSGHMGDGSSTTYIA